MKQGGFFFFSFLDGKKLTYNNLQIKHKLSINMENESKSPIIQLITFYLIYLKTSYIQKLYYIRKYA